MPEPLPGLMAVLAIDTPTHVGEPMHLPEGLPDVGTAMELALRNLRELPDPDHDSVLPVAGPGVLPGLEWLAQFAAGEFETQPGPVTPHVYHRAADGSTSVVTHQGEEGIEILVEGAFGQAFNAVMGDDRD
ncbi:hypothetical protein IGS73_11255 [Janibacter indicus]|uniref:Uncharacterized protein n=1 Tax=Janibacter indicus TaxID=857417 RepID=A0A7L9IWQ3_9MICO|nr:hypothetical protein [Janibacter indicus]QOK21718.1 hypothetical protein IGS73_11255 [Janibacter indicus]